MNSLCVVDTGDKSEVANTSANFRKKFENGPNGDTHSGVRGKLFREKKRKSRVRLNLNFAELDTFLKMKEEIPVSL